MEFQAVESPPAREFWYRADATRMSWGPPRVSVLGYKVVRRTPKGVWLDYYGTEKFVLRDAHKRWACPTKEEAMESFWARKRRQVKILRAQLQHIEAVLATSGAPVVEDEEWLLS